MNWENFQLFSPKRQLILTRDRLGIKPLYYIAGENQFLFASEVRSLLASGLSDSKINPTGLYHYLSFGHLKSPETLICNIKELKPGHYLVVDSDGNVKETQYWHPLDILNEPDKDGQAIQELLHESVRFRQFLRLFSLTQDCQSVTSVQSVRKVKSRPAVFAAW